MSKYTGPTMTGPTMNGAPTRTIGVWPKDPMGDWRGQMHDVERLLLFMTVCETRPTVAVESGTWYGGGSTFFTALALATVGAGRLYTWEMSEERCQSAQDSFDKYAPGLKDRVTFYRGDFNEGIADFRHIDYATVDGPEHDEYTLDSVKIIEPKMRPGGRIICHDWKTLKCKKAKDYLADSPHWRIETVLDTETGIARIVRTS